MRAMRQKVSIILICISTCVCAASFFLLPDIAAVQWSGGEAVNFLPGFAVPIIGFVITLLCNFVWSVLAPKWDTAMVYTPMRVLLFILGTLLGASGIIFNFIILLMN